MKRSSKIRPHQSGSPMKAIITTLVTAALTLLVVTPQAQARHPQQNRVYVNGYPSCGTRVYTERYFIGYDRCGNPVWGTRTVRQSYPQVVYPQRYIAPCPQPYSPRYSSYQSRCQKPYYGSGIRVQTTYRRY